MKIDTDQLFIRSPEQMYEAFPKHAEAVARSQEIADRVDIDLDLTKRHFPVFEPPPPSLQAFVRPSEPAPESSSKAWVWMVLVGALAFGEWPAGTTYAGTAIVIASGLFLAYEAPLRAWASARFISTARGYGYQLTIN